MVPTQTSSPGEAGVALGFAAGVYRAAHETVGLCAGAFHALEVLAGGVAS